MTPAKVRDVRSELILEKAQTLIASEGVEVVTMQRLAAETKLSRPAIYQYFASRDHVLAELVLNEIADLSNEIDSHLAKLDEPLEQVRVWIHYTLAHLASAEHRVIRQISIANLPEESRGMVRGMHGHFMTALVNPIAELGAKDVTATCQLIYASVAEAAKRIDEGSEFIREAAALEQFTIAGIIGTLRLNN